MTSPARLVVAVLTMGIAFSPADAQQAGEVVETQSPSDDAASEAPTVPSKVDIDPLAADEQIEARLNRILTAADRFQSPQVQVDEGIVFLSGQTSSEEYRKWAGDLARRTQDVVAVVNRIEVREGPVWDLSPAWSEIRRMFRETIQALPLIGLATLLLIATWFISKWAVRFAGWLFEARISNRLLRDVATRAIAVPVFLIGLYLVLRISGLTQMAATVIGGTGVLGLVVGIAFRDIAENFLASILISVQRPFVVGDLIEVDNHRGYVQSVTTRGTMLMTLDGNHVQIPNATIYKSVIHNFTANPAMRLNFVVGIGYDDSVTDAQEVALAVLSDHPVVLKDPEPLVLVDELAASTVNLHVYFWINVHEHSILKARSSVIRLVKRSLEKAGISMPDEAREVVFPEGIPLSRPLPEEDSVPDSRPRRLVSASEVDGDDEGDDEVTNIAEGGLSSEASEIQQQAAQSRTMEDGINLLDDEPPQKVAVPTNR